MSEYKFILFFVIALFFLFLHFLSSKIYKNAPQLFDGVGKISMINDNDRGDSWFYVDININGVMHSAKTDNYKRAPKDTAIGDIVSVKYYYTDGGTVRCYITTEGFVRVIQENKARKPVSLIISGVFFAVFLIQLLKMLLSS